MTAAPTPSAAGGAATAGPAWQPMHTAPRDGTHILAVTIEPGDDDACTRDYEIVREVWWKPVRGFLGESLPWRSGGYGHDDQPGAESYSEGLVLCWMPIPTTGRLNRRQAEHARYAPARPIATRMTP